MRLLLLAAVLAACAQGDPTGPAAGPKDIRGEAAAGKAHFAQAGCAACHKIGAEGSAVGPDLTMVGWRYSSAWLDFMLKDPQAWKAGTLMPNPELSEPARRAIVAYLAGLQGSDWPKGARPWDVLSLAKDPVARGRAIYARAGCIGCHGGGGAGGYPNPNARGGLIPALNNVSDGYSKAELIAKVRKGVPSPEKADPAGSAPLVGMPAWGGKLDDAELDAVASYLLTLSPAKAEKNDW